MAVLGLQWIGNLSTNCYSHDSKSSRRLPLSKIGKKDKNFKDIAKIKTYLKSHEYL